MCENSFIYFYGNVGLEFFNMFQELFFDETLWITLMVYLLSCHKPSAFRGTFTLNLLLILFVLEACVAGETNCESETGKGWILPLQKVSQSNTTYRVTALYFGLFTQFWAL